MTESTRPPDDASPDDASLDDDAVEALLTGRGDAHDRLAAALRGLRAGAARPAPEPSPALAELFAHGMRTDELARRRRHRGIVLSIAVAGTSATLTLSGVAAAHDALPGPAQGVIRDFINSFTPFSIDSNRDQAPLPKPTDPAPLGGAPVASESTDDHGAATGDEPAGDDGRQRNPGGGSGSSDEGSGSDSDGSSGSSRDGSGSGASDGDAGSTKDGSGSSGGGSGSGGSGGGDSTSSTPSPEQSSGGSDGGGGGSDNGGSSNGGSGGGSNGGSTDPGSTHGDSTTHGG